MGETIQFPGSRAQSGDEVVHIHPVMDDAMEPTARSGDVWVYRPADRYAGPGIYAVSIGGCYPVFRRLEAVPGSGRAQVRIKSDNPLCEPQAVDLGGVRILGKALAVMRHPLGSA